MPKHTPPTMQVAIVFNPGCEECRRLVASMTDQAVREPRVTRWTVTKGTSHLHEVRDQAIAAKAVQPADELLFEMPRSDTNGFDPDM